MAKLGKRLKKAYEGLDRSALLAIEDAVKAIKSAAAGTKFDETVEISKKSQKISTRFPMKF